MTTSSVLEKNHSTTLALIDLHDKISSALDNGELAVDVFLDLSKAFDTVDHSILFDKLEHYGIRGLSLKWVKSYFSDSNLLNITAMFLHVTTSLLVSHKALF